MLAVAAIYRTMVVVEIDRTLAGAGIGLVLAAAILVRRHLSILLWGSLALGVVTQIVLIGADAYAPRIRLSFLSPPNPYYRTLGWSAYGRTVGQLARSTLHCS